MVTLLLILELFYVYTLLSFIYVFAKKNSCSCNCKLCNKLRFATSVLFHSTGKVSGVTNGGQGCAPPPPGKLNEKWVPLEIS